MKKAWWKEAVVYQIYPRSFMDSNGDGIGDLPGIVGKLDYLKNLGVDVVWLSPVYASPNDDNGYDISDYRDIMKDFGTLADWKVLLKGLHERGMKLVMDLVVNHSSDEHPWFVESRSSRDNPKRDFYIWRPGKGGREPNNWGSFFSPSAWKLDPTTGEYYLHLFSEKQPDLNWDNPAVKEEIFAMMRWWLDQGIDGFRMDVINFISKPSGLPDSPKPPTHPDGYVHDPALYANQPGGHKILQEMNEKLLSRYDVMTVGETPEVTPETAALYVGDDRHELNMVFQFEMMGIDGGPGGKWDVRPWKLSVFKMLIAKWQLGLHDKGWNSLYLNNHDQPRMVSRFGDDVRFRKESAKLLGTMLHTLQGTPYVYQGEEIGMTNVDFPSIDDYRDIETHHFYRTAQKEGRDDEEILKAIRRMSRDNARTPMQWTAGANAGFSTGRPWIGVNPNHTAINVEESEKDPDSILNYYRKLIRLRKSLPVLVYGDYRPCFENDETLFLYERRFERQSVGIVLNFTGENVPLPTLEKTFPHARLLLANYPQNKDEPSVLRPYEAQVWGADLE